MKSIQSIIFSKLQRDDKLLINGERYIVINNIDCFYNVEKNIMEKSIELIKEDAPRLTPNYFVDYSIETGKFLRFGKNDGKYKKITITSIVLQTK